MSFLPNRSKCRTRRSGQFSLIESLETRSFLSATGPQSISAVAGSVPEFNAVELSGAVRTLTQIVVYVSLVNPGGTESVSARLSLEGRGLTGGVAGVRVAFSIPGYGIKIGSALTDRSGNVTLPFSPGVSLLPGKYDLLVKFNGNKQFHSCFASGILAVAKGPPELAVTPVTGKIGQTISVQAKLVGENGNFAIAGRQITFTIGSKTYTAKTDLNGVATIPYKITSAVSTSITAKFVGDDYFYAAIGYGFLQVR